MHHRPTGGPAQIGHHLLGFRAQHRPLRIGQVRGVPRYSITTQATRVRATGARDLGGVDRHLGLLDTDGLDTTPLPRARPVINSDTPSLDQADTKPPTPTPFTNRL